MKDSEVIFNYVKKLRQISYLLHKHVKSKEKFVSVDYAIDKLIHLKK